VKRFASDINRNFSPARRERGRVRRDRIDRILLLAAAAAFVSGTAAGQFVSLSRCRDAFPCSIPFSVVHRPDPLIAGQYAGPATSALSVRVPLDSPLAPEVETRATDTKAIDDAIRTLLHRYPQLAESRRTPAEIPARHAPELAAARR
jgi:hypothetical protein